LPTIHRSKVKIPDRKVIKSRRKCRKHIKKTSWPKSGPRYAFTLLRQRDFEILPDGTVINFTTRSV